MGIGMVYDLILIGIIALFTFIGYKQGLVKSAIKILSFFIAIVIAFVLYRPVSNFIINNTTLDDNIKNTIIEKIKPEGIDINQELTEEDKLELNIVGIASNTIEEIASTFTINLIETATLLLIFIIVRIGLKFATVLSDFITKLPFLKQVNKLGGTIYGFIEGFIIVYTLLAVVYLITPLLNKPVLDSINESIITKEIYNNNIILNMII